ncbi:hypothetical protein Tsubulata_011354, partial [Turnera subulata]
KSNQDYKPAKMSSTHTAMERTRILANHFLLSPSPATPTTTTTLSSNACLSYTPPEDAEKVVFDTREMRKLLDWHNIEERDWLFGLMQEGEVFNPVERGGKLFVIPDYNQSKEHQREMTRRRIGWLAERGVFEGWLTEKGAEWELRRLAMEEVLGAYDHSLPIKGGAVKFLGTKRHHDKWLKATETFAIIGCFAMTELGHGSNVRGIETVATYDASTGEFVINTPCESAQKYWIGGAANDATHSVVFSQLHMNGVNQGVHAFIVQIRDANKNVCPNVRIADCGHKIGLNGVDNGRIWFDNVRVPRENLLNSVADVTTDGQYISPIEDPDRRFAAFMAPLTSGRVTIGSTAIYASKISLSIAIRYALTRRAFSITPNGPELLLLDYPSHQRRLLPLLAKTYAMNFAANYLKMMYVNRRPETNKTLHVVSSALKAIFTWHNMRTLQECREACGGQGLKTENRIGHMKGEYDVQSTFEGDNNVLMQQIGAFRLRERDLLNRFAAEVAEYQAKGESKESACLQAYQLAEDLGRAFSHRVVLDTFIEAEARVPAAASPSPPTTTTLSSNACLGYTPPEQAETVAFDAKEMRKLLDWHNIEEREWLFSLVFNPVERGGRVFVIPDYNQSKEHQREMTRRRIRWLAERGVFKGWLTGKGAEWELRRIAMEEVGGAVKFLGTKRHHDKWLKATETFEIIGCFAMTELGHGSNVRGIETVATYDASTREFVINTPCESAQKYWIGGAADDATHAVVFSQLNMNGVNQGVHAFIVQIRDANGNICPNIRIADCGHKIGLNGVDNGRIWFDNVRVPRENLLNSVADVSPDGQYLSAIKDPDQRFAAFMAPLTSGRVTIGVTAISASKISLAIAVRYALTRRAFSITPNGPELLLLDYPSHQRRLLPLLAKTYAMNFAGNYLKMMYVKRTPETNKTLHVVSSALKAIFTWHNMRTLQECREACGGQGLKTENRIGHMKGEYDVQSTFEGDNNVLMQQVSKGLLGEYTAAKKRNKPFKGAFRLRERDLLNRFAAEISDYQAKGEIRESAFLQAYQLAEDLGIGFSHRVILDTFIEAEARVPAGSLKDVLGLVRSMYAVTCLEEDASFLRYGYLSPQNDAAIRKEVKKLCSELRPHALALIKPTTEMSSHHPPPADTVSRRARILSNHFLHGPLPSPSSPQAAPLSSNACLSFLPAEKAEPSSVFDTKEMRKVLDWHNVEERDWLLGLFQQGEVFNPEEKGGKVFCVPDYNQTMEQQREMTMRRIRWMAERGVFKGWLTGNGEEAELRRLSMEELVAVYDHSLAIKIGVHFLLWGGAIKFLGTKRHHDKWLKVTEDYKIMGCFAMTELGHGSNVRGIETVATYDARTGEFVINTPCESAQKYWIGGAANDATHTVVFSQLHMNGANQGVHAFIVQIRDANGNICPNLRIADCGHKIGLNGVDNGRIWFDNVRIPSENLLNSVADVSPDGQYLSAIKDPDQRFAAFMSPLTSGRVTIGMLAINSSKISLSIAIRYVLSFAGNYMKMIFVKRSPETNKTLHILTSALKALFTWHNMRTLQECREACGGQGLKSENRIGQMKGEYDVQSTFEGDNNVLMQQVSKALLGEYAAAKKRNKPFKGLGLEHMNGPCPVIPSQLTSTILRSSQFQIDAFRLRERDLLNRFAAEVAEYQAKGESKESAYLQAYQLAEDLGRAFSDRVTLETCIEAEASVSASLKDVLGLVRSMYAVICIEEDASFLRYGYLSPQHVAALRKEVKELCSDMRPHALALVSSFGIPDALLSPIAFDWIEANSWSSVKQ